MSCRFVFAIAGFLCAHILVPVARADLFGFSSVTHSDPSHAGIGERQISLEVTTAGVNRVSFTFRNSGPTASSIDHFYVDDESDHVLHGINRIVNGPGTLFSSRVSGSDPGGMGMNFVVDFSAGASTTARSASTGIDPGEQISVLFDLANGHTLDDVLNDLRNGRVRVAVDAAFAAGANEMFIDTPSVVPPPSSILLGILGLLAAYQFRRARATRSHVA